MLKKVKKHLKEDAKDFRKEAKEDDKLGKELSKYEKLNKAFARDKNGLMAKSKEMKRR